VLRCYPWHEHQLRRAYLRWVSAPEIEGNTLRRRCEAAVAGGPHLRALGPQPHRVDHRAVGNVSVGDLDLSNFLLAIYLMRLGTIIERSFAGCATSVTGSAAPTCESSFALRRGRPAYVKRPTDLFRALLVTSGAINQEGRSPGRARHGRAASGPRTSGRVLVCLTKKGVRVADQMVETLATESVIAPAMQQLSKARDSRAAASHCPC